jgi:glycosyltransferase involved in cell wall biosynthesis
MIRVLALTRYSRSAASSRQRFLIFEDYLASKGIALTVSPFFEEDYIAHLNGGQVFGLSALLRDYRRRIAALQQRHKFDVVWIEKEALPYLPGGLEILLLGNSRVLLDLDDAWHLRYAGGAVRRLLLGRKMRRITRRASVLAVANDGLNAWSRQVGAEPDRTTLLPTGLDTAHYEVAPEPSGPFTLGWIGGPFTVQYLSQIAAPLRRLSAEGVRLLVVGETKPIASLSGVTVEQQPWSEASESALLARCHIGLNPLPDDEWCKFKSGYKLIQYMAAGRAAVASPIGANAWVQTGDETGLFATTDEEWYQAICRLRDDGALRQRLAAGGRRRAEQVFSIEALGDKVAALIQAAARTP